MPQSILVCWFSDWKKLARRSSQNKGSSDKRVTQFFATSTAALTQTLIENK
jgi:hypothetical protein